MIRVKAILMPHLIADRSVFTGNWVAVISISGTIVPRAVRLHKHQSFPMQDEPEGGACFQHKMSLKGEACWG
jgi:hypothetical protein